MAVFLKKSCFVTLKLNNKAILHVKHIWALIIWCLILKNCLFWTFGISWLRLRHVMNYTSFEFRISKTAKITAIFGSIPLLMVSYAKNTYKFCLKGVSGHFGAKLIKKISNFDFSHFHLIFEKKFWEAQNTLFWAQIHGWMIFP